MLTGDSRTVADSVAAELGIDEVYSELLPGDKVAKVEELLACAANCASNCLTNVASKLCLNFGSNSFLKDDANFDDLDAADKEVPALVGHVDQARQKVAGVGVRDRKSVV